MSKRLFHYTNIDGLLGILETQSLYATHYNYLNDLSEGKLIREKFLQILTAELVDITPKLIELGVVRKELLSEFGRTIYPKEAENMYNSIVGVTNALTPFFITSFCEHAENTEAYENGLLSQWRGYGSGGGFAIEFDEAKLDECIKLEGKLFAYSGIKSQEVIYRDHDKQFDPEQFSGIAKAIMREMYQSLGIDISKITGSKNIEDVYEPFVKLAPFLKNPSFAEENEYRIAAVVFRGKAINATEKRPAQKIFFRDRQGLIMPYIRLFSKLESKLPITSILVGPHPYQLSQKEAIQIAVEQLGLDIQVRLSTIPFRGQR